VKIRRKSAADWSRCDASPLVSAFSGPLLLALTFLSLQESPHTSWRENGARIAIGEPLSRTTRTRSHSTLTPHGLTVVRVVLHNIFGFLHSWMSFVGLSRLYTTPTCQKKSSEAFWSLNEGHFVVEKGPESR